MIRSRVINNLYYDKQRFINKRKGRKLTLKDGSTLTSQNDILKGIKYFYANLFSIHDGHSQHELLNDVDNYCSIDPLDEKKAILLESEITINELGEALEKQNEHQEKHKKTQRKNNNTPGLDGFPTDFFKVFFLAEIEFFCFKSTK